MAKPIRLIVVPREELDHRRVAEALLRFVRAKAASPAQDQRSPASKSSEAHRG